MSSIFPASASWSPRVPGDAIVDDSAQGLFLLHPTKPRWAMVNRTGLEMVRLLNGTRTLAQVGSELSARFGIAQETALTDAEAFVAQLEEAGLLENPRSEAKRAVDQHHEAHRLTIYITEECNLRCKHCFVVEGVMPQPKLSANDVRGLIEDHLGRWPKSVIAFSGGEALLREDCVELLKFASARAQEVQINTNGILVSDAMAAKLAAIPNLYVQVSLDGADPAVHDLIRGKGTFEKAWTAIERLARAGMARRLRTATTLTRCTLPQVRVLVEKIEALGLYEMRFLVLNRLKAAVTNREQMEPDVEELKRVYRYLLVELPMREPPLKTLVEGEFPGFVPNPAVDGTHWCPMGETSIVDSQGDVYGCPMLLSDEGKIGNVHRDGLEKIQNGERAQAIRDRMMARRYVLPECRACAWRNFCQGSCQAFSQIRTGTVWATDEFCEFRRELYRENARRQAFEKASSISRRTKRAPKTAVKH